MGGSAVAGSGGWLRAAGLIVGTGLFTVGNPGVLVAIPFCLLVAFMLPNRLFAVALVALVGAWMATGNPTSGLWYVERGWSLLLGGCFLALSLRWPDRRFLNRGLGAVVGAFLGAALLFGARPGDWAIVDWAVRSRVEASWAYLLEMVRMNVGADGMPPGFEASLQEMAAFQGFAFPALVGLASLSALGLAWWLFRKIGASSGEGVGALREFRFNDQFVWVLIMGLLTLLIFSGALERIGTNAVVFMGGLYALRGAAVVLSLTGGVSLFGGVLLAVAFLFAAPFLMAGAMFIGLGDTWFDLRTRRASPSPEA